MILRLCTQGTTARPVPENNQRIRILAVETLWTLDLRLEGLVLKPQSR
jgi:hypothetical protein